jgi:purine-binding chemotaxis protein CheW
MVGILVDAVNEVTDIAASDIEPAPSFGAHIRTEFIAGMARINERFVIVLEPNRVLPVDEIAAVVESVSAHEGEAVSGLTQ